MKNADLEKQIKLTQLQAELEGMKSANYNASLKGEDLPYNYQDFMKLVESLNSI